MRTGCSRSFKRLRKLLTIAVSSCLNPIFEVNGAQVVLVTQFMAVVLFAILQVPTTNLNAEHEAITRSVDMVRRASGLGRFSSPRCPQQAFALQERTLFLGLGACCCRARPPAGADRFLPGYLQKRSG
ncbi:hypothetical protein GS646_20545 [Ruegeria sp. HKCCD4315]|nr:hypothetical protein [Ruegeria sp. HKCCD4318]NOE13110.1 hypothetical protein [Ruegeria sp. HKCCD4318-2]NOG11348.1 hypothetical protein [Ruegeria sp. HKCCD4315]